MPRHRTTTRDRCRTRLEESLDEGGPDAAPLVRWVDDHILDVGSKATVGHAPCEADQPFLLPRPNGQPASISPSRPRQPCDPATNRRWHRGLGRHRPGWLVRSQAALPRSQYQPPMRASLRPISERTIGCDGRWPRPTPRPDAHPRHVAPVAERVHEGAADDDAVDDTAEPAHVRRPRDTEADRDRDRAATANVAQEGRSTPGGSDRRAPVTPTNDTA